jgi:hypothetical protein
MKSVFIALTILLTLAPLKTFAQTVFMGPNGEPLGSAYNLNPRQNRCQDDIIVVMPGPSRNRVMDDFYDAQERTQRMFERQRQLREQREQRQNRRN